MAKSVLKIIKAAPNAKAGAAKGKAVTKTTDAKGRQIVKAKSPDAPAKAPRTPKRQKGFWGIVAGTKKEQVAIALDAAGRDAAMKKAKALGIAEGSAKGWVGTWRREGRYVEAKTSAAKKAVRKAAEKLQDIAADAGAEVAEKAGEQQTV